MRGVSLWCWRRATECEVAGGAAGLGGKGGGEGIWVKGAGGELIVEAGEVVDEPVADGRAQLGDAVEELEGGCGVLLPSEDLAQRSPLRLVYGMGCR